MFGSLRCFELCVPHSLNNWNCLWILSFLKLWTFESLKLWNFETLDCWNFETLNFWNFESLKLWNVKSFETLKPSNQATLLFSSKGIPSTPQHTDPHHRTQPPFWGTRVVGALENPDLRFWGGSGGHFSVHFEKWVARKLRRIILLHFRWVTF